MTLPATLTLHTGVAVALREAEARDAVRLTRHFGVCAGESDYLSFGVGEYDRSVEAERTRIEESSRESNRLYVVGCVNDEMVASLVVSASSRPRRRHLGEFGIVVQSDYWGRGIGRALMNILLDWATDSTLTKLTLKVRADNARAIRLYERLGFEHEATLRAELFDGTRYHDVLYMSIMMKTATPNE